MLAMPSVGGQARLNRRIPALPDRRQHTRYQRVVGKIIDTCCCFRTGRNEVNRRTRINECFEHREHSIDGNIKNVTTMSSKSYPDSVTYSGDPYAF